MLGYFCTTSNFEWENVHLSIKGEVFLVFKLAKVLANISECLWVGGQQKEKENYWTSLDSFQKGEKNINTHTHMNAKAKKTWILISQFTPFFFPKFISLS